LIEDEKFSGFKIYPALGYFPFDKDLLNYMQYASEKHIPIITHCSKGPVFYRGKKKTEWNYHPIFNKFGKEGENEDCESLKLQGYKNSKFTSYFSHPLNYHCLLNKDLLNIYLEKNKINKDYNFSDLKICLAHFGGEEEIQKYFNNLYADYEKVLGYDTGKSTLDHNNRHQIWYNASWFKVILDLMKAYPNNVYTDISYTLNNFDLIPLIKDIIKHHQINNQILFGTDFYMVSQERSEKEIVHTYRGALGEELFNQIAYENPKRFLNLKS